MRFWKEKSVEDTVTLGPTARATLVYIFKGIAGKNIGGPVIVHPGASSVQLLTSVTNGKLAHPVGGGWSIFYKFIMGGGCHEKIY